AEGLGEAARRGEGAAGARGEIEDEAPVGAIAGDVEGPAVGAEADVVGLASQVPEEDVGGGEGGVPAKIDLGGGGEPADGEVAEAALAGRGGDEEGGLGDVVLGGDGLEGA